MRPIFLSTLLCFVFALGVTTSVAEACARGTVSKAERTALPTKRIDQALFSKAVLAEVNYYRCQHGLSRIRVERGLIKVAETHSSWMTSSRQLDHRSNVRGYSTLGERIEKSGFRIRKGASENIGYAHRFFLDNGRRFFTVDAGRCVFTDANRDPIPQHTYGSLARWIVKLWMESPSHRKNILDGRMSHTAAAIAFDGGAPNCGVYYATQKFVG